MSAAFHGAAAALVAFPLLWEATARFAILSSTAGAVLLAVVAGTCLAVAWRQRLRSFAWLTVASAAFTSMALLIATRELAVFSLLLGVAKRMVAETVTSPQARYWWDAFFKVCDLVAINTKSMDLHPMAEPKPKKEKK